MNLNIHLYNFIFFVIFSNKNVEKIFRGESRPRKGRPFLHHKFGVKKSKNWVKQKTKIWSKKSKKFGAKKPPFGAKKSKIFGKKSKKFGAKKPQFGAKKTKNLGKKSKKCGVKSRPLEMGNFARKTYLVNK